MIHLQAEPYMPCYTNLSKLIAKYSDLPGIRPDTSDILCTQTTHLMKEEFTENWK